MAVMGVGIDLVDVQELDQLLVVSNRAFLEAGWTPSELKQGAGQSARLAASWAAKEAAMKALGIGLGDIDPLELEVDMRDHRRPVIRLSGAAAAVSQRLGVCALTISVAVDRRWALATAFAVRNGQ
jgi:holo-[acyl-carrier protein] synthase